MPQELESPPRPQSEAQTHSSPKSHQSQSDKEKSAKDKARFRIQE